MHTFGESLLLPGRLETLSVAHWKHSWDSESQALPESQGCPGLSGTFRQRSSNPKSSLLSSLESKAFLSQVVSQKDGGSTCCDAFALLVVLGVGRLLVWFHFLSTCSSCCLGCTKTLPMRRLCCVVELAQENTKGAFLTGCQEAPKQGNMEATPENIKGGFSPC